MIPSEVSLSSFIKYYIVHFINRGLNKDVPTVNNITMNTNIHYPKDTPINDQINPFLSFFLFSNYFMNL